MRVLYVEDSAVDADLARRFLSRAAPWLDLVVSTSLSDARGRLAAGAGFDVVLSDLRLPDGSGLELLSQLREIDGSVPFVILTGLGDQETAIAALRAGADDYVLKDDQYIDRLPGLLTELTGNERVRRWRFGRTLRVLYCEHSRADADLTRRYLESKAPHLHIEVVWSAQEALDRLTAPAPASFDVLLLDYRMNDLDGLELTRALKERGVRAPVVIVTGHGSHEVAARALHLGVADYLVKSPGYLEALPFALEKACQEGEIARQQADMETLRRRLERVLAASSSILYTLRPDLPGMPATWVSDNVERILGYSAQAGLTPGWWSGHLHPEDRERALGDEARILAEGHVAREYRFRHADGTYRHMSDEAVLLRDSAGRPMEIVGTWVDITERKDAEASLRRSEALFRHLFDEAAVGAAIVSLDRRFVRVNRALEEMTGYTELELTGRSIEDILHPGDAALYAGRDDALLRGEVDHVETETRFLRKDGGVAWARVLVRLLRGEDGEPRSFLPLIVDITERKSLEAQLLQSQKMEAIGVLAGGVAHDFNNMLAVIRGFVELAMEKAAPDDPIQDDLREVQAAARRSADLTRQLLSFARKQAASPRVLDLNAALASLTGMLSRLIGEDVELRVAPEKDLWSVRIDPAQLDQILTNLLANARDAIAGVGTISVETSNAPLKGGDGAHAHGADVPPGDYVLLSVTDTGCGMDEATQARIFEPFFTTKGDGKGSGLGLSMVYGIVRQNGGCILVTSRPGAGTTFRIYLPRFVGSPAERTHASVEAAQRVRGLETVLVVEDEPAVLRLVRTGLSQRGFTVLAASSVEEAIALVEQPSVEVDALVTDVVMPSMNGVQLEERIRRLQPEIRTVFMSGYTANAVAERGLLPENVRFIQKPFTLDALAAKVREALDA